MASSSSSSFLSSSNSEPPIVEQVITEFFAKSLHIILESRSPYVSSRNYSLDRLSSSSLSSSPCSPSTGGTRPRHKWFNLALRDCPAALENFDLWRQSNLEPLVIDIVLVSHSSSPEKVLERWVIQYETRKDQICSKKSNSTSSNLYNNTYRGSIVMFRSLYLLVRLLPAYNLFCDLNSSGKIKPLSLSHRISSFVEPFTRAEESEMGQFNFTPIDTPCGRLSLSVWYSTKLDEICSEPSTPISTEFIPDYVGSPNTDPLKRFNSFSLFGSAPVCVQTGRRNSWSNDPLVIPSISPNPSPAYSDSHALMNRNPRPGLPPAPPHGNVSPSEGQKGNNAFLFRCDSAPVHIPVPRPVIKLGEASRRKEKVRLGEVETRVALEKAQVLSPGQEETGCFGGAKVLSDSSRVGSRVSFLDEFDDSELGYPFAPDDEDLLDDCKRIEVSEGKRSQDAIVGALLRKLRSTQPLRIGFDKPDRPVPLPEAFGSLGFALEELKSYKQLRDSILSRSGYHLSNFESRKE